MTEKQKRFADEYLIDLNATRAYRAAYPAVKKEEAARANASRLLTNANVKAYLDGRLEEIKSHKTADAAEVLETLTAILRGELCEEVPLFCGDGCQQLAEKRPANKDRLKAAELLGKRYGLFEPQGGTAGAAIADFLAAVRPAQEAVAALYGAEEDGNAEGR